MRKILVPTDFSENAMNALQYALELFKYDVSEFFIMHAYQDEVYAEDSLINKKPVDEINKIISNKSLKQLENTLKKINKISPNPRHSYNILSSNNILIDEVDKIVVDENIDIIVMGTRGKTNDSKLTFGSHTLQVLKFVQCPVLAIPENYKHIQPRKILFPTNYMIPYKRRELKLLCELASPYRAVIDIIYISKSNKLSLRQKDNQKFIREHLCKNNLNLITINGTNITNTINKYIKENEIDMLVMVNSRHAFLESILFQSTIDKMTLYIDIPFLALQNFSRL
jgi:nucleotide-binding universal stress UspA family protein